MNRRSIALTAVFTLLAAPVLAQSPSDPQPLGAVVNGDRTIVFEHARLDDEYAVRLKTWDAFAQAHREIERELGRHPALLDDPGYLRKHPELDALLSEHPELRRAMVENPGNFIAPAR